MDRVEGRWFDQRRSTGAALVVTPVLISIVERQSLRKQHGTAATSGRNDVWIVAPTGQIYRFGHIMMDADGRVLPIGQPPGGRPGAGEKKRPGIAGSAIPRRNLTIPERLSRESLARLGSRPRDGDVWMVGPREGTTTARRNARGEADSKERKDEPEGT